MKLIFVKVLFLKILDSAFFIDIYLHGFLVKDWTPLIKKK